ncbi:MAG: ABC transporter ATP-binding protein [Deltaproteobacteria bacterium]
MENPPLLAVENLHVFYGSIHALRGVSFSVPKGKIVTLVGANGAGKTTSLRAVSGLIPPREGRVMFQNRDITNKPAHEVARMGIIMVPEGRKIFPNLTVRENLIIGTFARGSSPDAAESFGYVLSLFPRLGERLSQLGGTLSGGEQQMLAVGRALMGKPTLLMLDEPSLGLAPKITFALFEKILEIHRGGTTVLMIEQNAKAALQMADYAYVLESGQIALEGDANTLLGDERVKDCYLGR